MTHALLIPDYLHYRLTGNMNWEYTNATTTQLVNINSGEWDRELLAWAGADASWFGTPRAPGNTVGYWRNASGQRIPVVAVASHDTASAVMASPLEQDDAAYLCSGTWSLMGFESQQPCASDAALAANITNEGGAEGRRYRVLKNIMGLWLLQRVLKRTAHQRSACADCRHRAANRPAALLIHPNDDRFINPAQYERRRSRPPAPNGRCPCRTALPNWRAASLTAWPCSIADTCSELSEPARRLRCVSCISSAAVARTSY